MDLSGQPPRRVPWLLARWILLTSVMAGVFAMHVLAMPEPAGGHGMLMQLQPASMSMSDHGDSAPGIPGRASMKPSAAEVSPAADMSGSMLSCILFLVTGGSLMLLMLLMLLASRRPADRLGSRQPSLLLWTVPRRGPPGGRPPRISLCVLRV